MEGVVSLDNSVGAEINGDGTVDLNYLVEAGSHSVSLDDLSIWVVCIGTGIIFMSGLSVESSINYMNLFNIIFLHCWAHIRAMYL